MVEQVVKVIPSKGTRWKIFVTLELFATFLLALAFFGIGSDIGVNASWWSTFTQWNAGIYAASETGVKGAEGYLNHG